MRRTLLRAAIATAVLTPFASTMVMAHHGWSWAEAEQIELSGTITAISFAPPHPSMEVQADGGVWKVELSNPGKTQRSGFVEGVADVGDAVTLIGNRSKDREELRMKAVRVMVGNKTYDIYPERIETN
ncbi:MULTISPECIES: DUF6152 family protein [Pseudorhizobium]|jgi:hypothetical protein|uniref:Uncharacterized protein n=1 Tax=Pseudorhizobium halotolerans TaxID=1233081 RepID=A0ABN7JS55_9HYPH|nr:MULTISPECIES: DUF6152 family protein [Pseudorhizobium]CAD7045165.1 hypothetical protein RHAB21_03513 [Pseudorhizobium halotolerans]